MYSAMLTVNASLRLCMALNNISRLQGSLLQLSRAPPALQLSLHYLAFGRVIRYGCSFGAGRTLCVPNDKGTSSARPLNANFIDYGKVCGVGPGLVFAAELQRRQLEVSDRPPPERIGLVPCARGGTSLSEWDREGPLYRAMVERTAAALQGGATLRCMLWYQGESDTSSAELAEGYTSKLENFFQSVRADLHHPDLPIIQVGVVTGNLPSCQYIGRLREAQRQVHLPGVFLVDAMGLALQPDQLHLTTTSQVQLGKQLTEMYLARVLPHLVT